MLLAAGEPIRKCGRRKIGGLYLVSPPLDAVACDRLPLPLGTCKTCGRPIAFQARGWTWWEPTKFLPVHRAGCTCVNTFCDVCVPPPDRHGLMWVGARYYKTPSDWLAEAIALGVSKRLPGLVLGLTQRIRDRTLACYVAHPAAIPAWPTAQVVGDFGTVAPRITSEKPAPGIIAAFRPSAVELVVTEQMARERQEWAQRTGVKLHVVEAVDTDTEQVLL
jgi:hypothetical protein